MSQTSSLKIRVLNRINEKKHGYQQVDVINDNDSNSTHPTDLMGSVFPGGEKVFPNSEYQKTFTSIILEARANGSTSNYRPLPDDNLIPITVSTSGDCHIKVLKERNNRKWKLTFIPPQITNGEVLSTKANAKPTGGTSQDSDVNVTVGGDEPPAPSPMTISLCTTLALALPATAIISRVVFEKFPQLWFLVPVIPAICGIGLFIYEKTRQNKNTTDSIEDTGK